MILEERSEGAAAAGAAAAAPQALGVQDAPAVAEGGAGSSIGETMAKVGGAVEGTGPEVEQANDVEGAGIAAAMAEAPGAVEAATPGGVEAAAPTSKLGLVEGLGAAVLPAAAAGQAATATSVFKVADATPVGSSDATAVREAPVAAESVFRIPDAVPAAAMVIPSADDEFPVLKTSAGAPLSGGRPPSPGLTSYATMAASPREGKPPTPPRGRNGSPQQGSPRQGSPRQGSPRQTGAAGANVQPERVYNRSGAGPSSHIIRVSMERNSEDFNYSGPNSGNNGVSGFYSAASNTYLSAGNNTQEPEPAVAAAGAAAPLAPVAAAVATTVASGSGAPVAPGKGPSNLGRGQVNGSSGKNRGRGGKRK